MFFSRFFVVPSLPHILWRNEKDVCICFFPLLTTFFLFDPYVCPQRLIKEKSVENDAVIQETEVHIEEFQRVSISGEEKCGVRRPFPETIVSPSSN